MSERTSGAPYFRLFAGFAKAGLSPLYERLSRAIADDPEMLGFAAQARAGQPQANILLGAVHARLLSGVNDPLKEYYPSCGGKRKAGEGDVYTLFKAFVELHREALEPMIITRVTNTNEVGRSALIYPALDWVARETGQPLQIVEIGPSAGLNLNWQRYGYRYTDGAGATLIERQAAAPLVLETELRGSHRPRLAPTMPAVKTAIGLELNPVDLSNPDERLWLRALIWPERIDRLARLDAALRIAAAYPPRIERGDAAKDLPRRLSAFAPGPVCVVHTFVTYQFAESALAEFEAALKAVARERAVFRISVEWNGDAYALVSARYEGKDLIQGTLGTCDPHGQWLESADKG